MGERVNMYKNPKRSGMRGHYIDLGYNDIWRERARMAIFRIALVYARPPFIFADFLSPSLLSYPYTLRLTINISLKRPPACTHHIHALLYLSRGFTLPSFKCFSLVDGFSLRRRRAANGKPDTIV